jgi:glycosyltransferase involved in cell wall biosynthesis
MSLVSCFTPTHDSSFILEIYKSLQAQTDTEWEWIILFNNDAKFIQIDDPRVKCFIEPNMPKLVGTAKSISCSRATGEILLELDHDDLLMPTAIADVKEAFEDPSIGFVYSNSIQCTAGWDKVERFNEYYGWKYREVEVNGHILDEHIHFEPSPEVISRIWFAPNHLRAFRRTVYDQVGGYNREMRILDDLDIMCRMYLVTTFKHIDKGLYVYRVHGKNTWIQHQEEINANVYRIYDQYIHQLVERACSQRQLRRVELGGRMYAAPGYETVDLKGNPDIKADLNKRWPFETSSVGVVRAFDVFEHLRNPIHTMKELSRVLAPGGWAFIQVPSTDGRGAFQDPTHCSFWNENSFLYYTNQRLAQYIDAPVRFQAPRLYTNDKNADQVCWVTAHLLNCKDGYRPCGGLDI